ncbi:TonB-dependent receptor [Mariniradius saccharolyticus AK6]|uniref:TonB-dependent receptor n=2 Tax=Mariniradius TaxID=1245590 RepID=M7X3K7_9BACT|nr:MULTISPECIES: TonB-dependent receptor [Mariniradius]EMS32070.1 TonB-dependent receptor [Mariniradius saccharolyticus AK6]MCF1749656.1 TonB-dependent receptor [Mariniradius sediminis]
MRLILLLSLFSFTSFSSFAQGGEIRGRVFNPINNEGIPFANVVLVGTDLGTVSDENGNYALTNIPPGLYNVRASFVGYRSKTFFEIQVSLARPVRLDIDLLEEASDLSEVTVDAEFSRSDETPISVRRLNTNEIERYPGGNRDISRVIQSLPGVASTASFRNDIIIRGGAPNENKFFIDEIEVPVINHFATQGSSGGPVGILNVNLIKNVDVITGGFPADRMNSLSSFFNFQLKEGRKDKMFTQMTLGASELTLSNEGPLGKNTTYLISARRSYLQFLFRQLELPFLPTFNDFTIKTTTKLNAKTELTFLGVGAIDQFALNFNEPRDETEEERENRLYLLESLPISSQWNYMTGLKLKRFRENGFWTFILSRNMLNNRQYKYAQNDESSPANLLFDYTSQESENKFRAENSVFAKGFNFKYGVNYEYSRYFIKNLDRSTGAADGEVIFANATAFFNSYGGFVSANKTFLNERLLVTAGLRMDGSDFGQTARNPLNQVSPRFSVSYQIKPNLFWTANSGIYYQKPPYTALGYRDNAGNLVNQQNDIRFIRSTHFITGFEKVIPEKSRRFSVEGFYKFYDNYPSSIRNGISLANLGADFGVIGNEPVSSDSKGRAYGLEFLAQQRLFKSFYGIGAVTLVRSEFTNPNTVGFIPSAWDSRIIVSLTAGKRFKNNWEVGARWRYLGGLPYTPVDIETSSLIEVWDKRGQAVLDFNQINALRLKAFHQLDFRVDKRYFFNRWNLNWYFDVQNAYNFQAEQPPVLVPVRDTDGSIKIDPNDPTRYQMRLIENPAGTILPTIGIIVEF